MATTSSRLQLDPRQLMQSSAFSGLTPVDIPPDYDSPPPPYDTRSTLNSAAAGGAPIITTQPSSINNDRAPPPPYPIITQQPSSISEDDVKGRCCDHGCGHSCIQTHVACCGAHCFKCYSVRCCGASNVEAIKQQMLKPPCDTKACHCCVSCIGKCSGYGCVSGYSESCVGEHGKAVIDGLENDPCCDTVLGKMCVGIMSFGGCVCFLTCFKHMKCCRGLPCFSECQINTIECAEHCWCAIGTTIGYLLLAIVAAIGSCFVCMMNVCTYDTYERRTTVVVYT